MAPKRATLCWRICGSPRLSGVRVSGKHAVFPVGFEEALCHADQGQWPSPAPRTGRSPRTGRAASKGGPFRGHGHFRNVALSKQDLKNGSFVKISDLGLEEHVAIKIWLEGVPFPLLLAPAARMGC